LPAVTVCVALPGEVMAMLKSTTPTLALATLLLELGSKEPLVAPITEPPLEILPGPLGVRTTLTMAEPPDASVLNEHVSVGGVPLGVVHVPGDALAETKVELASDKMSLKTTPEAASGPLLVTV
jgi:hypothetical protein